MPSRMTTQSTGRQTAAPRGGRIGGRTSKGGGRTGDQNGQGSNQDYDGKGGAIAYTRWIEKMESVQDMSGCGANKKVKYTVGLFIDKALTWWNTQVQTRGQETVVSMTWEDFKVLIRKELCPNNEMQKLETEFWCHAMVGAGHATYSDRFYELARLVPHLVTLENKRIERYIYGLAPQIRTMVAATEPITIQSVVLKAGMLTDKAIKNGSLSKNTEKRGNGRDPSRDGNVRGDHKRSRTGREFASTTNPVRREYTGVAPKARPRIVNLVNAKNSTATRGACLECGGTDHHKAACPRSWKQWQPNTGKSFYDGSRGSSPGPEHYDGYVHSNNHYATILFNSSADYSFVSTTFIPLLSMEPSRLGFTYEIEIASGQLVEINKLSRHKAEIVCHEKVVRIPLPNGKILRVLGEKLKEKMKHLMSAKIEEQKLKDIVVVRNYPEVFPNDLSRLPPSREFKFYINLIPRAMAIAKSPYRLAPSKLEELSSQV
ncbi:putative reverse transcriptase domain-containing protein [Tanacetum coccineum]